VNSHLRGSPGLPAGLRSSAEGGGGPILAAAVERSFEPVSTRRTFEEAVVQIAERVKLGELRPGDKLPSERDLAAQMRISRPTVREALRSLRAEHVLVADARRQRR